MTDEHERLSVMVSIMRSKPNQESQKKCVYVVRHGNTALNGETGNGVDKIRGWADIPLAKEGEDQAECVGDWLKDKGIEYIYSSDLSRAYKTAQIIKGEVGEVPLKKMMQFRPWDLGIYTGKETKKFIDEMKDYITHPKKMVPDGESFNDFLDRYLGGLRKIFEDIKAGRFNHVVVVSHYRNLKAAQGWAEAGMDGDFKTEVMFQDDAPPGSILAFENNGNDKKWEFSIIPYDEIEGEENGEGSEAGDKENEQESYNEKEDGAKASSGF